jgi:uncharacterized protein
MSATIIQAPPAQAPASNIKAVLQRHPIAAYFVLMFSGLWLGYLPLLLSSQGFGVLPFRFPFPAELFNIPASLLGPLVAGAVMAWALGGKQGLRAFRGRVFRFRVAPQWYIIPLVSIPMLGVLAVATTQGTAPVSQFISHLGDFIMPYLMGAVLLSVVINLWEESGQVGFVLPLLQRRRGAVLASLIIAPMWALMHMPALFVPDLGVGVEGPLSLEGIALSLGVLIVYAIPVRLIATWLFNNARQSVPVVAVFHAAMNAVQGQLQTLLPGYNTFYLLGAFAVVSFILIAVTRGKLGYQAAPEPSAGAPNSVQPAAPLLQAPSR